MTCRLAHQPTHSCLDIYGNDVSTNPAKCAAGRRAEYGKTLAFDGEMKIAGGHLCGRNVACRVVLTIPADFIDAWRNGQ